ncbi:HD superfamily phosphohydrolase [Methanohalophilus levihalophilus]|nr:HD superfamily phosphohydrolase [Methanohalophilus levihalophilus]
MHDIGHYPFSHAMEDAIKEHLKKPSQDLDNTTIDDLHSETFLNHESVGREILRLDVEIRTILESNNYDVHEIYSLFISNGEKFDYEDEKQFNISNIISSDLDADRLDYLLRSAYHLGLPYGSTDLQYILLQMKLDADQNICIDPKALRTVDHFLLCRYFDYSQVIYHKSVVAFEEVLKKVILYLLENNELQYISEENKSLIEDSGWYEYDDLYVMNKIRDYYKKSDLEPSIQLLIKSLINRVPPKEVLRLESIQDRNSYSNKHISAFRDFKNWLPEISEKFSIPEEDVIIWDLKGFSITKIGRSFEIESDESGIDEGIRKTVRIYDRISGTSVPIMQRDDSLMYFLSGKALYSIRLYILFDKDIISSEDMVAKVDEIKNYIQNKWPREWK